MILPVIMKVMKNKTHGILRNTVCFYLTIFSQNDLNHYRVQSLS